MCFFSIFPGHLLLNTKKKKKKKDLPTYLPYFFWNRYRKQTIFFFRPKYQVLPFMIHIVLEPTVVFNVLVTRYSGYGYKILRIVFGVAYINGLKKLFPNHKVKLVTRYS